MLGFYNCCFWTPNSHWFLFILLQIPQIFVCRIIFVSNSPFPWHCMLLLTVPLSWTHPVLPGKEVLGPCPLPTLRPRTSSLPPTMFLSCSPISLLSAYPSDRITEMVSLTFDPRAYSRTFCLAFTHSLALFSPASLSHISPLVSPKPSPVPHLFGLA